MKMEKNRIYILIFFPSAASCVFVLCVCPLRVCSEEKLHSVTCMQILSVRYMCKFVLEQCLLWAGAAN